jgi:hypothetical protein
MRRVALLSILLFALTVPVSAQSWRTLVDVTVTTAVTAVTTDPVPLGREFTVGRYIAIQGNFTYGSGGTNATAYVQTSIDGGITWCDVASFQWTTASARKVSAVTTYVALAAATTCTDGSLTANTILNGLLGNMYRVKYTTTGTYAGGTRLKITAVPR